MPKSSARLLSTDREIQTIKVDSQRPEFRIKGAKNLVLRVTGGGTKTWTFLYRSPVSGKRAKLSIGEYPSRSLASARTEALVLTLAVDKGKDPLVERRADTGADTFAALAKLFMAEHLLRNAREGQESIHTQELQRILDADILPAIGDYKAFAVKRFHVSTLVEAVANRGALVAADRALGLVRDLSLGQCDGPS
jgi:Arm DNA-binding domain